MALYVSPFNTLTVLSDIKKDPNSPFSPSHSQTNFLCFMLTATSRESYDPHLPSHILSDRSRFLTFVLDPDHPVQRTVFTTDIRWSTQRTMMNNPRSYLSLLKTQTMYNHRQTTPHTLHHLNQPHALQLRNLHRHLPPTSRQTNRFGPKYDGSPYGPPRAPLCPSPTLGQPQRTCRNPHRPLALNAIDTLARFPPAAYFTDPNLGAQASPSPPSQADPSPSCIPPLRFYPVPTAAARHTTIQDAATQTSLFSVSILENPLTPPGLNQSQQTTPRPHTHHRHIQTDIHAIVQLPSFAGILPPRDANQPDSSTPTTNMPHTTSPNPTSATNKQPHDRWQYVNLIPTPTVTLPEHQHTTPAFPSPIGGTPRNRRSKTPPRSTTPTRTRQPDPRTGSPIPYRTAPPPAPQQSSFTVHPLPKRPPPSLHQAQQPPATSEPLQPVPPATGWPNFQGGSYTPTPSTAPPHTTAPPTHPWPAHYPVPTQQQSCTISTLASSAAFAPPSPVVMLHPPTTRVDSQGRPLPLGQQEYDPSTDPWCADNY